MNEADFQKKLIEQQTGLTGKFDALIGKFKQKINNLFLNQENSAEAKLEIEKFSKLITAFEDFKNQLFEKLMSAGDHWETPDALQEIEVLFDLIINILENGFDDFNKTNDLAEQKLMATIFSKTEKDEKTNITRNISVGFNFVATQKAQARFKINYEYGGRAYSLRIDRDLEHGGIFVDLETPTFEKILARSHQDHHFKIAALNEFVGEDEFATFVENIKKLFMQSETHYTLQELLAKYGK